MSPVSGLARRRLRDQAARLRDQAALIALVIAWALLIQAPSANQTSHYALIRSLAAGTARIDGYAGQTIDESEFQGHIYSNKAPGMALLATPVYVLLDRTGLAAAARRAASHLAASSGVGAKSGAAESIRVDRGIIWVLTLWAVVLPAAILLLLVRAVAERMHPGSGLITAVMLGAATLVMPFATMLYSHVLAATLAFAAFAVLYLGRPGARRLLVAGVLAGLAVTTEYPLAIAAALIGIYALARERSLRTALIYGGGCLAGLVPLGLYDLLAFGSITHLSYVGALPTTGSAISPHRSGFFGVGLPQPARALRVLLAPKGLLVLTPGVALAAAGLVAMRRGAARAEVALAAAVAIAFFIYNAGYFGPLGGQTPGARFMLATLPFVVLGWGAALRRWPGPAVAMAAASAAAMLLATITTPQIGGSDLSVWTSQAASGDLQYTVLGALGLGHGWAAMIPVLVLVAAALVLAARRTRPALGSRDVVWGLAAVAVWAVLVVIAGSVSPGNAVPAGCVGAVAALLALAALRLAPASPAGVAGATGATGATGGGAGPAGSGPYNAEPVGGRR